MISLPSGVSHPGKAPQIIRYQLGNIVASAIYHISDLDSRLKLHQYIVMPDHVHFLLEVVEEIPMALGSYIGHMKILITQQYANTLSLDAPQTKAPVFNPDFYDCILYPERDLNTVYNYIQDNPRRLAERRDHPEWFQRVNYLTLDGLPCQAYGNLQLIQNPFIEAVVVRSVHSAEVRKADRERWLYAAANKGVLASAAYSQHEKEIMKEADRLGSKFIYFTEKPIDKFCKPQGHAFELCSQGKLLLIYVNPGLFSRKRDWCLRMNSLAQTLAGR